MLSRGKSKAGLLFGGSTEEELRRMILNARLCCDRIIERCKPRASLALRMRWHKPTFAEGSGGQVGQCP